MNELQSIEELFSCALQAALDWPAPKRRVFCSEQRPTAVASRRGAPPSESSAQLSAWRKRPQSATTLLWPCTWTRLRSSESSSWLCFHVPKSCLKGASSGSEAPRRRGKQLLVTSIGSLLGRPAGREDLDTGFKLQQRAKGCLDEDYGLRCSLRLRREASTWRAHVLNLPSRPSASSATAPSCIGCLEKSIEIL